MVARAEHLKRPEQHPQPGPQQQPQPGLENRMSPKPMDEDPRYKGSEKLKGKVALITGGDSGIGRAVAIAFAKEGADCAIVYLPQEEEDAERTRARLQELGRRCAKIPGDLGSAKFCSEVVERTMRELGRLDIVVNNAGVGAQGGDVEAVVTHAKSADGAGLMVSSSRAILYASKGDDFADAAANAARELRDQINRFR